MSEIVLDASEGRLGVIPQQSSSLPSLHILWMKSVFSAGGHRDILIITDQFTRYAPATPSKNQSAKTTARILFNNFICHYGLPARLHSDQGRNFESEGIKELCYIASIDKSMTTPYHPIRNGMSERFSQTLINKIGTLEDDQKADCNSYVPSLVHAYNSTCHESRLLAPLHDVWMTYNVKDDECQFGGGECHRV